MASSENKKTWFGKSYVQHYNDAGEKSGKSFDKTNPITNKTKTVHTDQNNNKIGSSENVKDAFTGKTHIQHFDKDGTATSYTERKKTFFSKNKSYTKAGKKRTTQEYLAIIILIGLAIYFIVKVILPIAFVLTTPLITVIALVNLIKSKDEKYFKYSLICSTLFIFDYLFKGYSSHLMADESFIAENLYFYVGGAFICFALSIVSFFFNHLNQILLKFNIENINVRKSIVVLLFLILLIPFYFVENKFLQKSAQEKHILMDKVTAEKPNLVDKVAAEKPNLDQPIQTNKDVLNENIQYIGFVHNIYTSNNNIVDSEVYVEPYFTKDEINADEYNKIEKLAYPSNYDVLRQIFPDSLSQKYFDLRGLSKLKIYDKNNKFICNADFVRIEYLLENSKFVAVFKTDKLIKKDGYYGISNFNGTFEQLSYKVSKDTIMTQNILTKLNEQGPYYGLENNGTHLSFSSSDTILSIVNSENFAYITLTTNKDFKVLYKSSEFQNIYDLRIIPLTNNKLPCILTNNGKPETCWNWDLFLIYNGKIYIATNKQRNE